MEIQSEEELLQILRREAVAAAGKELVRQLLAQKLLGAAEPR